jgi:tetratricopeptide (TPR) repeat protein
MAYFPATWHNQAMKQVMVSALALFMLAAAVAAAAQDSPNCAQPFDAELRIKACSALLAKGGLAPAARARILHNRGAGHHIVGRYGKALEDYGRALALDDTRAATYNIRADAHMRLCRADLAMADYDRAMELDGARRVRALQGFLKRHGSYDGPVNGRYRPATRAALKAYVRSFKCEPKPGVLPKGKPR